MTFPVCRKCMNPAFFCFCFFVLDLQRCCAKQAVERSRVENFQVSVRKHMHSIRIQKKDENDIHEC